MFGLPDAAWLPSYSQVDQTVIRSGKEQTVMFTSKTVLMSEDLPEPL